MFHPRFNQSSDTIKSNIFYPHEEEYQLKKVILDLDFLLELQKLGIRQYVSRGKEG